MTDLDDFLPYIMPKAPGCPTPTAHIALRQAAMEFCARTKLWRDSATFLMSGLDDIHFNPPDGAVLIDFESVLFNDVPLEAKTAAWMDQCMRGWRRGTIEGYPRFFAQTNMGTLRVAPIDTGVLTVNYWLKPTIEADQLPDFLLDQYAETIAWGALGRILSTPEQPFTDFNTGAAYAAAFEQKIASQSFKVAGGQQRARVRSKAQF
jgi:hypothetical protein